MQLFEADLREAPPSGERGTFIRQLRAVVDDEWKRIKSGEFWQRVMREPVTPDLYRDLMLQVFHYSRHNSINQAVAAFVPAPEGLLKFVYRHAAEELGHEHMVTHDLRGAGLLRVGDTDRPPLPATEALIGYLYYVSLRYGAVARLGYSFWAEGAHAHIQELLMKAARDLKLAHKDMTFFGSHALADEEHIRQVEDAIERFATSERDQELVRRVALTTLSLTGQLMEQVSRANPAGGRA